MNNKWENTAYLNHTLNVVHFAPAVRVLNSIDSAIWANVEGQLKQISNALIFEIEYAE